MTIKQFLKSDRRKIVTFVIIFIIAFLYGSLFWIPAPCPLPRCPSSQWVKLPWYLCEICRTPTAYDYLNGISYIIAFPTSLIEINLTGFLFSILLIPLIIIQFFYWYLLSCVIVWIYDKFRKKNKK